MKLVSDVKGERKISIELNEKELAYIICSMNIADEVIVREEAGSEKMDIIDIEQDEEVDLIENLEDIYWVGGK